MKFIEIILIATKDMIEDKDNIVEFLKSKGILVVAEGTVLYSIAVPEDKVSLAIKLIKDEKRFGKKGIKIIV